MTELLLSGLIAWRLAALLVFDDGPGGIISSFRIWAFGSFYPISNPSGEVTYGQNKPIPVLGGLLGCVGCLSLWMAPLAFAVVRFAPEEVGLILGAWAFATLAQRALP